MAPQRIQRMILRVQQYDLIVRHRPGDQLYIAYTLTRASQLESTSQADEFEVHLLVQISKEKAHEFKREMDPVLSKLKKVILTGWPESRSEVKPELQDYWNFGDELCICDGLLTEGDRLITPYSLRDEMLEKIQGSLMGVENV